MDVLKQQIQQKLVANILVDKCTHSKRLIFRDAWCTQERIIRFTTPFFRALFSCEENETGRWKTGDSVMYECHNNVNSLTVNCLLSLSSTDYANMEIKDSLLKAAGVRNDSVSLDIILKTWELTSDEDVNQLMESFDYLIENEIPNWEQELNKRIKESEEQPLFTEGASAYTSLNRYERNPKARAACLAAHGTACAVCGLDFAKAYGPEFAGKIEVHHIVPLSEIGEEYVVNPVKDLVPVCPNCHTALHSKKNGVYTVDELKAIRAKREKQADTQ